MKTVETKDGIVLEVIVKPKSKAFNIAVEGNEVIIYCAEEPSKGKANKEIVRELSRHLRRRVKLIAGFRSKRKKILVVGINRKEAESALSERAS